MHVHLRRAGAVALLAAGGMLTSSACVTNESTLFIRGCLAVPRDTCEVQVSTNSTFTFEGSIDGYLSAIGEYHCLALFENQLVARGDSTKLRTETSRITVYQAEVQILNTDPNNPAQIQPAFTVPVSGFADPGSGTDPGVGATDITLLNHTAVKALADKAFAEDALQNVVASVVLHGRTLGGTEVTSNEFRYPIAVSAGASCSVPVGEVCADSTSKPTADCLLGQDGAVDCRFLGATHDLACAYLNCAKDSLGKSIYASATCPPSGKADGSCCFP